MKTEKNSPGKQQGGTQLKKPSKKSKGMGTAGSSNSTTTQNAKARSGRGLANEGTIPSYEEER